MGPLDKVGCEAFLEEATSVGEVALADVPLVAFFASCTVPVVAPLPGVVPKEGVAVLGEGILPVRTPPLLPGMFLSLEETRPVVVETPELLIPGNVGTLPLDDIPFGRSALPCLLDKVCLTA